MKHRGTDPEAIRVAEKLGLVFDGMMEGFYEFTVAKGPEEAIGITFVVKDLSRVEPRLAEKLKEFGIEEGNPPPIKARARIFWTRERTDERIKILKKLGLEQEPYWAQPWDKLPSHYKEAIAIHYSTTLPPPQARGGNPGGNPMPEYRYYYCANTQSHSNNEVIQVKTDQENPKCPYCGGVMTYGRYWGPLLSTQISAKEKRGNPMTSAEIEEVTRAIFDIVECTNATLFDRRGQPICPIFASLPEDLQQTAFEGMKARIKSEGLQGYINRKRLTWGVRATDAVVEYLSAKDLI